MIFFNVARVILWPFAKILYGLRTTGLDNIPKKGRVILVSNHVHLIDPGLHAMCIPRSFRAMAKEELFKNRIVGFFMWLLGAFPVKRGRADKSGIEYAAQILNDEKMLMIFPEGTRSKRGKLAEFKGGVAILNRMTGAPIVPAAIIAPRGVKPFHYIRIKYGKPISHDELWTGTKDLDVVAGRVRRRVAELMEEANNGDC
ncbi:MAG: lysophospholipid acyltransferase family protein [Oscillospiraceae bacterium]